MTVRVSAADENIRAYSHVERFQMMSKKNPNLLKHYICSSETAVSETVISEIENKQIRI